MKISMYDACVKPGIRMMNNLAAVLEKTAQHAQARKIDPEVLLGARLAPDMFPLARQVQIASDSAKMGAARVAGVEAPAYEDNEKSLPELIERAKKTAAYLETLKPQQFEGSEDRTVKWWDAAQLVERGRLEAQPDLAPALAFTAGNARFVVGRLDGSLQFFDAKTGQPGKPAREIQ